MILSLINYEIELDFSCSRYCVISEISKTPAVPANPNASPPVPFAAQTTSATFPISKEKLYVLVVSLYKNGNMKFLENIKQGFKRLFLGTNIDLK